MKRTLLLCCLVLALTNFYSVGRIPRNPASGLLG